MPIDISKALAECKRLTLEAQKEYQCAQCTRHCRAYAISEPLSCVFNENQAIWKKVDKRWKPSKGERYFYVSDNGFVEFTYWQIEEVDHDYYEFGNCFRTEKQAMKALEKVKETLLKCQEEIE